MCNFEINADLSSNNRRMAALTVAEAGSGCREEVSWIRAGCLSPVQLANTSAHPSGPVSQILESKNQAHGIIRE